MHSEIKVPTHGDIKNLIFTLNIGGAIGKNLKNEKGGVNRLFENKIL